MNQLETCFSEFVKIFSIASDLFVSVTTTSQSQFQFCWKKLEWRGHNSGTFWLPLGLTSTPKHHVHSSQQEKAELCEAYERCPASIQNAHTVRGSRQWEFDAVSQLGTQSVAQHQYSLPETCSPAAFVAPLDEAKVSLK